MICRRMSFVSHYNAFCLKAMHLEHNKSPGCLSGLERHGTKCFVYAIEVMVSIPGMAKK